MKAIWNNQVIAESAETVFIDDMSENLAGASQVGIQTIRFVDADQCRKDLMSLGCI